MPAEHIKHKSHVQAQPTSLRARPAARVIPNDLSIIRATLSTPWPIAGPITNVPLRVYALVADLHVAGVSEDLYPDDRLRFGNAMDLRVFHSRFRMEDALVPASAICWY